MNLLDILFPERCLFCKKYGKYICDSCYEKIDKRYVFKEIKNNYFDYMICSSFYKEDIRIKMHNFKFHEEAYLYKYFIELSLQNKKIYNFLKKFDLITYVPMSHNKENIRGYNQSELLAKELGKNLNIKVVCMLKKIYNNAVQSTLSEKDRKDNVKDVFKVIKNINIQNKNIILVDDILTTGSTIKECAKLLRLENVNKICVFAISKTKK